MTSEVTAPEPGALVEVRLIGVPLDAYCRASQHHDELRREFAFIAQARGADERSIPVRLLSVAEQLNQRFASFTADPGQELDAAVVAGRAAIDVVYRVPAEAGPAAAEFDALLDEADEFCRAGGELLTLAAPPRAAAFRKWFLGEFARQAAGHPPTPWTEPKPEEADA